MFNMREWCELHRKAVDANRAELADLLKFVSANVLDADAAARVQTKIAKALDKFEAVALSGESLILAYEADQGSKVDVRRADDAAGTDCGAVADTKRETQVVGPGDVGSLPGGLLPGSDPVGTGPGGFDPLKDPAESGVDREQEKEAEKELHEKLSPAGNTTPDNGPAPTTGEGSGSNGGSGSGPD